MIEAKTYDVAIVGGGIVGAAAAMSISTRFDVSLALIEKEDRLAAHQTGHNSGVIHSGLYYRPGSLKARCCAAGRRALFRFLEEEGLPNERLGKIVVATHEEELSTLDRLEANGRENGLLGLRRLKEDEMREHEPNIRSLAGLLVPETGIVDFKAVTEAYGRRTAKEGGDIFLDTRLFSVRTEDGRLILNTTKGDIRAKNLVNCAGLFCDRVARMCGTRPDIRIVPFRGEYYELVQEKRYLVNRLVYPVPDPRYPFLGVHFTRTLDGGVEAGPNAVLALKREGYRWRDMSIEDMASYLSYPGFWKMARAHWKTGLSEVYRSLSKRAFVKALRSLMPELGMSHVTRAESGVRAQALLRNGDFADDFKIAEKERMIHVLNAPSPAATASLSIADMLADLAGKRFGLKEKMK